MNTETTTTQLSELIQSASSRSCRYLETLSKRAVFPTPEALAKLPDLSEPLSEQGEDPEKVLDSLDSFGSATVSTAGGRYFGFVMGGTGPAALAAGILTTAWDQNAIMQVTSPVAVRLEQLALSWLRSLLGLPATCAGIMVTGATMANFTCLAAARHRLLERRGWDVEARGLFGAPEIPVVVSEETHASVLKALALLGLGRQRVTAVPTDAQGRLRVDALPPMSTPHIVCIQAGNVNTGSFDPVLEVSEVVHRAGGWVHVDGAFGLWAACAPNRSCHTRGLSSADSWATDGHKWLNVPYDCGMAFVRDAPSLQAAMRMDADYFQLGGEWEPIHWGPDASRRARGVEVWAALKSLGSRGVADLVERTCRYAEHFARGLREAGFEILNDVVLNQVLVSFGDDTFTRRVIRAVQNDGTCWCGGTVWQGRFAMRISVSSWLTREEDVEAGLRAIIRLAKEVAQKS